MRMDRSQELTAATSSIMYDEERLAELFYSRYGEEPKARQIAGLIVRGRPFATTDELAASCRQGLAGA